MSVVVVAILLSESVVPVSCVLPLTDMSAVDGQTSAHVSSPGSVHGSRNTNVTILVSTSR